MNAGDNQQPSDSAKRSPLRGDIAIIGMSCLFPGAPNLQTYWQNIVSKVDAMSDPPLDTWDAGIFYDPTSTATDRVYCKRGGWIGPLARFNPLAHGIVPLAVEGGEPDQWLALQLATDALADAGYLGRIPNGQQTSIILGKGNYINRGNLSLIQHGLMVEQVIQVLRQTHPEYNEDDFTAVRDDLKRSLPPLNTDTASALIPNVIVGRIANRLDLMGPAYTVDGACASSILAVEIAIRDLLNGQSDLALVGGAQITTPIPILTLFCQLNALSHRQELRAFDADADGTVLGEGIGMVVLKRRDEAERDGDRIYAVIKGVGSASDGRAVSVMAPRLEGEVLALQRAYEMAGVEPTTVELVEAHGTGTTVGDAVEIKALTAVFGGRDRAFARTAVGTVKTMIGHTMPASGIAGMIKAALALYHKTLPPTLHCDTPNPKLELEKTPFYINTETRPWIHGQRSTPRRAGVNAFGFGGINGHLILEEAATDHEDTQPSLHQRWDSEVFLLAADSREALERRIGRLQACLAERPELALKDIAYTLNVATDALKVTHTWRLAVIATTVDDLQQKLGRAAQRVADPRCTTIKDVRGIYFSSRPLTADGKLAMLFPGEGAQYVNMLADLCIHFPEVRACFDQIDRGFIDHPRRYLPSDIIFPRPSFSKEERAASARRIWQMDSAIEAVLTANHALFTLLKALKIQPDVIVGHSTGEYSALRAAGVIDLDDEEVYMTFLDTLNRSYELELAQDGVPRAALMAVGADPSQVAAIAEEVGGEMYLAMINCPHQTVLAGSEEGIARAADLARQRGFIHEVLPFDRAYHTPLFGPYADGLRRIYADLPISPPQVETYSCTSTGPFPNDADAIRALALEHWVRPVEFQKTVTNLYEAGVRVFLEVGPKGNLTAFIEDILGDQPYLAVPTNVARRSGITGLNHMVGMLAINGVSIALEYLYARRAPQTLDLVLESDTSPLSTVRPETGRPLAVGWPPLSLSSELTERLRSKTRGDGHAATVAQPSLHASMPAVEPVGVALPVETPTIAATNEVEGAYIAETPAAALVADLLPEVVPQPTPVAPAAPLMNGGARVVSGEVLHPPTPAVESVPLPLSPSFPSARGGGGAQAMHAFLETMERFTVTQEQLMQGYVQVVRRQREQRTGNGHAVPGNGASVRSDNQGAGGGVERSDR